MKKDMVVFNLHARICMGPWRGIVLKWTPEIGLYGRVTIAHSSSIFYIKKKTSIHLENFVFMSMSKLVKRGQGTNLPGL